jgi:hypothetical protein
MGHPATLGLRSDHAPRGQLSSASTARFFLATRIHGSNVAANAGCFGRRNLLRIIAGSVCSVGRTLGHTPPGPDCSPPAGTSPAVSISTRSWSFSLITTPSKLERTFTRNRRRHRSGMAGQTNSIQPDQVHDLSFGVRCQHHKGTTRHRRHRHGGDTAKTNNDGLSAMSAEPE